MRAITEAELLSVWEQDLNRPLLHRMLILLAAVFPEMQPDTLMRLSIGQRDQYLLRLRECLFGQQLLNTALCPKCNERVEWENSTADFLAQSEHDGSIDRGTDNEFDLDVDDYTIRFRLPNSLDISAITGHSPDVESNSNAEQHLLSRCLVKIEHSGARCDVEQLPDAIIQKLHQQFDILDPQANIYINLSCPACSHSWDVLFDIASFLWVELNDWAEKMLQNVHKLATAYGWSESQILALSPVRRKLYLGMLEL